MDIGNINIMKVFELIEILQLCNPNAEVAIGDFMAEVKDVKINENYIHIIERDAE
jgi:hypothetical protein